MDKEIKENINIKNQEAKIEIPDEFYMTLFFSFLFCLFVPAIFNFNTASITGKVFMIIATIVAIVVCTGLMWISIKMKEKKLIIFSSILILLLIWCGIHYFDYQMWGFRRYEIIGFGLLLIVGGYIYKGYELSKYFSKDKLIRIILAFSFLLGILGLFLMFNSEYGIKNNILFKIALGLIYLYVLVTLIEAYLMGKEKLKPQNKYYSAVLILKILVVAVAIFTLPAYVYWIGLDNVIEEFIQIYSSVIGGIIALVGVSWTIKVGNRNREEEEKLKYKPLFTAYSDPFCETEETTNINFYGFYNLDKSGIFTTDNLYDIVKKEDVLYHIPYIIFKNTDNSNFKIKKISLNGVDAYQQNVVIEKNKVFYINRLIVLNTYPEILIYTEDVLKKEHTFKVVFRNASEDKKIFENTRKTRKKTIKYITLHVLNIEEVEND